MAFSLNLHSSPPSLNNSLHPFLLTHQSNYPHFVIPKSPLKILTFSSNQQNVNVTNTNTNTTISTKRKLRPSFFDQIRDKWSVKLPSPRHEFPWQLPEEEEEEEEEEDKSEGEEEANVVESSIVNKQKAVSFSISNTYVSAPWIPKRKPIETQVGLEAESLRLDNDNVIGEETVGGSSSGMYDSVEEDGVHVEQVLNVEKEVSLKFEGKKYNDEPLSLVDKKFMEFSGDVASSSGESSGLRGLPWDGKGNLVTTEGNEKGKKSKTALAESLLPEHELRRLRSVALRMYERIKVGVAGVTQAVVDAIHEKWKLDEVVKLKFEEPLSLNMKRAHEILERKTGGLVIWRSGSSIVLFRGMNYKLPCVQSYTKKVYSHENVLPQSQTVKTDSLHTIRGLQSLKTTDYFVPDSMKFIKDLSKEEQMDFYELNELLNKLGPRFKDWTGREPLPVDADLLPAGVPGFKPPFRLLPYGVRHCLHDRETTILRRLARTIPPHFALGRNRELQGLAKAMVKLWERNVIAKIAIKRGVENTRNERMAEELKNLTGGTLLSRNKEYIVFYRGNDFLPPLVRDAVKERQTLTVYRQDEEELARQKAAASILSKAKPFTSQLIAGTLSETIAASTRWGQQLSSKDVEEMKKESTLTRQASVVRLVERKLAFADKALAKVQKDLIPSDIPTDLETITNEERFLFRKMGLSMKPFLLLGRRGVYGGTIENMHLHWKYRELVKVLVRGKNLAQVKHIAISLEAESGGVLVSVDKTTKGYMVIVYRGKNYRRPQALRPDNLLSRREALARSVELQRREALKHHIVDLEQELEASKSKLEQIENGTIISAENIFNSRMTDEYLSSDPIKEGGRVEIF
ncbi:hypothetical protein ACFE04_019356 [Oxalis oulophora]